MGSEGLRRAKRVASVARAGGVVATAYAATCSQAKAIFSPSNFKHSTFTQSALAELDGERGRRIFDSLTAGMGGAAPTCDIDAADVGANTRELARSAGIAGRPNTYAGNWVLFAKKGRRGLTNNAHVAVFCFYDCPGPDRIGPGGDPERLVKHMNLCTRASRDTWGDKYTYVFSGTFVAASKGIDDRAPIVRLDAISGSWALAKGLLSASGLLHPSDTDEALDAAAVEAATPLVREVVVRAITRGAPSRR